LGAAYEVAACLLIQGAAIIFPAQCLHTWTTAFVIAPLIIGFPIIFRFFDFYLIIKIRHSYMNNTFSRGVELINHQTTTFKRRKNYVETF
jgi:hypothetical protein